MSVWYPTRRGIARSELAPGGPFFYTSHYQSHQRKGTIISTSNTLTVDGSINASTVSEKLHQSSIALVANTSNWRKVAKDLIGDEPVTYEEKSKKDTLRKFPIINIFSTDPEALKRVQTKAAEVE